LIVDYDLSDCHTVIEEDTGLLYLDLWDMESDHELTWYRSSSAPQTISLIGSGRPDVLHTGVGAGLYGASLDFDASDQESVPFYDADNDPDAGYLVAVVAQLNDLDLEFGETRALMNKADDGGFALELLGDLGHPTLRFGVKVDGAYRYATRDTDDLSEDQSHFIVGAYDGNGRVRLWVNNTSVRVSESSTYSTGVEQNDSPVVLGADPEGVSDTRFHLTGRIQMAMVQKWRDH
jgi:hypothetical protein